AAETVRYEAESQIAEIRADLHEQDPIQRADHAHARAALLDGAGQKRRQPEEQPPVRELHGAAERNDAQRSADELRTENDFEWVLGFVAHAFRARDPRRRLAHV